MLPTFCLRLAVGLLACLPLLAPGEAARPRPFVGPRFFRTHFLTVLGLATLALLFLRDTAPGPELAALGLGVVLAFLGALAWSLEGAPGGRALILLTLLVLAGALGWREAASGDAPLLALAGGFTSAALLGAALSAMLMGHSYLIAPTMSIVPLLRLLAVLAAALAARMLVDGLALGRWTAGHPSATLMRGEVALWLPVRWGVGFLAPLVLCWMAWQTARIRSTQSATGILYVVVVFCFLGELTAQLLRGSGTTL